MARGDDGAAEAEALARELLELEPENPRVLLLLAGAMAQQGTDPGSEPMERALAIAPDAPAIVRGAARVALLRLQKVDLTDSDRRTVAIQARDLYTRAVALAPDSTAARAGLGYAQLALNQPAEANQSLQQAFILERFDLNVVLALGRAALEVRAARGRPETLARGGWLGARRGDACQGPRASGYLQAACNGGEDSG